MEFQNTRDKMSAMIPAVTALQWAANPSKSSLRDNEGTFQLPSNSSKRRIEVQFGGKENVSYTSIDDSRRGDKRASSFKESVKSIKAGASKTLENVRVTFGSLSQKLRRSTRRRYRLSSSPYTPSPSRLRPRPTPVKMYSPFSFESPAIAAKGRPGIRTPRRTYYSPTCRFRDDVAEVSKGCLQFQDVAEHIVRASMRRGAEKTTK